MSIKNYFFSFLLIYFCFHIFGFILSFVLEPIVYWSADTIFNIKYTFESNGYGSGDSTYAYLEMFWRFCFSLVLAIPLAILTKKYKLANTPGLTYSFLLLLRLYLAFFMLIYGIGKILPMQFPPLSLSRLAQPYGESSPMGLAWTFLQYSPAYAAFSGFAEAIGALLLLNRKTVTLGSIILTGVISNIVMMNFCYDIPVKISSFHMLLASLILLYSDRKRLYNFFIANKTAEPKKDIYSFKNKKDEKVLNAVKISLKGILALGIIAFFGVIYLSNSSSETPKLYGIYETTIPNQSKFSKFIFEKGNWGSIIYADKKEVFFDLELDTLKKTISLKSTDTKKPATEKFTFTQQPNGLVLQTESGETIHLNKKSREDFLLINRGFHWINETPFNR